MTADLVNAYIDMQLCEMERRALHAGPEWSGKRLEDKYPVAEVPKVCLDSSAIRSLIFTGS
jgi:hypothetical protein